MFKSTQEIHRFVLFPIAFIALLIIGSLHYFGYQHYQTILKTNTQKLNTSQLDAFTKISGNYIANFEAELLQELYQSIKKEEHVYGLSLYNKLANQKLGGIDQNNLPEYHNKVTLPILFNRQKVGSIEIIFNHNQLHRLQSNAFILLTSSFFLSTLIALGSLWLIYRLQIEAKIKENIEEKLTLKRLSEIDQLTQLANRRYYDHRLAELIEKTKRSNDILSMLLIDIDYFKLYNDNYGHDAGDVALKTIAQAIQESVPRARDLAARYGGEEFVVLLPSTDQKGAYQVAESIRRNVMALNIVHDHSEVNNIVTISTGISTLSGMDVTEGQFFKNADTALYSAKEKGRNQCVIFE